MKVFDPATHDFRPEDKEELKKDQQPDSKAAGECLDEALEETFPASDAPAITVPKEPAIAPVKPREDEGKK